MKKILALILLLIFWPTGSGAQQIVRNRTATGVPVNPCQTNQTYVDQTSQKLYHCDGAGNWIDSAAAGASVTISNNTVAKGNVAGNIVDSQITDNGTTVDLSGVLTSPNVNNIRFANDFAGADAEAKISAAITDLPSTGGTVDARGLEGAQTWGSTLTITKANVTILCNRRTSTFTVAAGTKAIRVVDPAGNGTHFTSYFRMEGCHFAAAASAVAVDLVHFDNSDFVTMIDNVIDASANTGNARAVFGTYTQFSYFKGNVYQGGAGASGDAFVLAPHTAGTTLPNSVTFIQNSYQSSGGIGKIIERGENITSVAERYMTNAGGALSYTDNAGNGGRNNIEHDSFFENNSVRDVRITVGEHIKIVNPLFAGTPIGNALQIDFCNDCEISGAMNIGSARTVTITAGSDNKIINSPGFTISDAGTRTYVQDGQTIGLAGAVSFLLPQGSAVRDLTAVGTDTFYFDLPRVNFRDPSNGFANQLAIINGAVSVVSSGSFQSPLYQTTTNCADSAGDAACAAAPAGSFVIDAADTTTVVSTTVVTANSQIILQRDDSLGARLTVTCNTQSSLTLGTPRPTARTAGTSFTATLDVAPTTNPMCINYWVVN